MNHSFTVEGDPVGKGRPRFTKSGRTFTPKRTKEYEGRIRRAYVRSGGPDFGEASVSVSIVAQFQMPQSWGKKRREKLCGTFCAKKPDTDNVIKSVLDALSGVAYTDDKQVVACSGIKQWAEHGSMFIDICILEEEEHEED